MVSGPPSRDGRPESYCDDGMDVADLYRPSGRSRNKRPMWTRETGVTVGEVQATNVDEEAKEWTVATRDQLVVGSLAWCDAKRKSQLKQDQQRNTTNGASKSACNNAQIRNDRSSEARRWRDDRCVRGEEME